MSVALDIALGYATRGLAVFPCHYPVINGQTRCSCGKPDCADAAKHPYGRHAPHGCNSASKDPRIITRWFRGAPFNIAIATGAVSGIVVVDIDPGHGGDQSLTRLEAEHGTLPTTWRAISGSGGEHYFFRHPAKPTPNSVGVIAPGIDLRGDGGYVVAAPSLHICGRRYAWNIDFYPDETDLAALPEWLTAKIAAPQAGKIDWRAFAGEIAPEGRRHQYLLRLCGILFHRLRTHEAHLAQALIVSFNKTHCDPPLGDEEVRQIIEWAAAAEKHKREGGL